VEEIRLALRAKFIELGGGGLCASVNPPSPTYHPDTNRPDGVSTDFNELISNCNVTLSDRPACLFTVFHGLIENGSFPSSGVSECFDWLAEPMLAEFVERFAGSLQRCVGLCCLP